MLNKAHDAAINKGAAITIKRVSISKNPFEIGKFNTLYIIVYYLLNSSSIIVFSLEKEFYFDKFLMIIYSLSTFLFYNNLLWYLAQKLWVQLMIFFGV